MPIRFCCIHSMFFYNPERFDMHATSTINGPNTTRVGAGLAMLICTGLLIAVGCSRQTAPVAEVPAAEVPASQAGTITVVFNLPEGKVRREIESVAAGTSIAELMAKIDDPKIEMTGSGAMTFVKSIGDLGTTEGKGWTFSVDGQWADRGIGAYELTPPATIQWKHGAFDPSDQ